MSTSLRLAVTGHRLNQLPEATRPELQREIERSLVVIGEAARAADAAPVLVSAIAEGADRFAALAALKLKWRLECPLPFNVARYEEDFHSAESVAEFRRLLSDAVKVAPIDGEALVASGQGEAAPYAAVGAALLRGAHGLLAVWNGAPKRGPGGTAEVVEKALAQGTAVIWLHPDARGPRLLMPTRRARRDSFRRLVSEQLAANFETCAFPDSAAG